MNSVSGITLRGVKAVPVEVEVEITGGLFNISGNGIDCIRSNGMWLCGNSSEKWGLPGFRKGWNKWIFDRYDR